MGQKKISLSKELVLQFDTFDVENNAISPTIRNKRELSTYGIETSVDVDQLKQVKEMIVKLQRETIRILEE